MSWRHGVAYIFMLAMIIWSACAGESVPTDSGDTGGRQDADVVGVDTWSDTGTDLSSLELPDIDAPDTVQDADLDVDIADAVDTVVPPSFVLRDLSEVGNINDMWGSPADSVWAVGDDGLVLVLRNNQFVPGPIPPTDADLYGVDGTGGAVYAVGEGGVVIRFVDGRWSILDCPVSADLLDVSCPSSDECFAVGRKGTVVHLRADSCEVVDPGVSWDLFGVLSDVNAGTFAVGAYGSLFQLSGDQWISSQIAGSIVSMRDIFRASDGTMVIVGTRGTVVKREPGGTLWEQQLTNDTAEPPRDLWAIAGTSSDDMWAVGSGGVVVRFDGRRWNVDTVAGPVNAMADFRATVAATWLADAALPEDKGLFLAAGMLSSMVFLDHGEGVWLDRRAGPSTDLNSVWVTAGDGYGETVGSSVIFVGDDGLALVWKDDRFGLVETGLVSRLRSIAGGVAVGDDGVVLSVNFDESTGIPLFMPVVSSTVEDLVDVAFDEEGWVLSGAEGSVFVMDESFAPRFAGQVSAALTSVCRTSAGVFVAGLAGFLAFAQPDENGDLEFSDVLTFTQSALRDLVALPDGSALAVGDNGVMLVCGENHCDRIHSNPASFLYGATTSADGGFPVFAAGWAGVVLMYDGQQVVSIESGTFHVFSSLDDSRDDGTVYLAGLGGVTAFMRPPSD